MVASDHTYCDLAVATGRAGSSPTMPGWVSLVWVSQSPSQRPCGRNGTSRCVPYNAWVSFAGVGEPIALTATLRSQRDEQVRPLQCLGEFRWCGWGNRPTLCDLAVATGRAGASPTMPGWVSLVWVRQPPSLQPCGRNGTSRLVPYNAWVSFAGVGEAVAK